MTCRCPLGIGVGTKRREVSLHLAVSSQAGILLPTATAQDLPQDLQITLIAPKGGVSEAMVWIWVLN